MKVLVTGAAGRVGRWVAKELAVAGHQLRLLDLQPTEGLAGEHVQGDVTDWETTCRATEGMEAVVHLAFLNPAGARQLARHIYYEREIIVDVLGTDLLLQACLDAGVKRFVYVSTGNVYDRIRPAEGEQVEEDRQALPESHYGMCKYLAEEVCRCYAQAHGLPCAVLRLYAVTFPDFPEQWERIRHHDTPEDAGIRVHILDVTRAVQVALEREGLRWGVFRILGANPDSRWATDYTRKVLGFQPEYRFEVGRVLRDGQPCEED